MSDIEKVKRHLSKPIPITIKNSEGTEDTFDFKPLNVEQQAILMELSKVIKSRDEIETEVEEDGKKVMQKVPDIKKEDLNDMFVVVLDVVKSSIEGIDEETALDFCNTNFDQLSDALFKLMPSNQSKKDLDSLIKAKERIQSGQQTETE